MNKELQERMVTSGALHRSCNERDLSKEMRLSTVPFYGQLAAYPLGPAADVSQLVSQTSNDVRSDTK